MADDVEYSSSEFEDEEEEGEEDEQIYNDSGVKENYGEICNDANNESNQESFKIKGVDTPQCVNNDLFHNNTSDDDGSMNSDHTTPEVLMAKLEQESQNYLDFNVLRVNKIKYLALCKVLHGEKHLKTAEAHLNLAEAYLKGKLYAQQVLKHSNISRDILLFAQKDSASSADVQYLLQSLYLVMGKGNIQLCKYKVAENCLQKAKLVSDNISVTSELKQLKRVEILSASGTALSKLGKLGQGIEYIEEALDIVKKLPHQYQNLNIKLHKQIVELEILNGKHANFAMASESIKKALKISLELNGHDSKETAEILTTKGRVEASKEDSNYDTVEESFKEALKIYISIDEPEKQLSVQKMHSKILLQQEKFTEAVVIVELAITKCEQIYGDSSTQCADLFELMGSIFFAQGKLGNALDNFSKAEGIYSEKRNCVKKKQRMVDIIDMIRKSSKDDKLKSSKAKLEKRPRFM